MTPTEANDLARLVHAACPQQKFDEYTPDVWFDLLADLDFEDCKHAVARAARDKPFVAPAEIRAHVQQIRHARLANSDQVIPAADPDEPRTYAAALRGQTTAIAGGRLPAAALEAGATAASPPSPSYVQARGIAYARRRLACSVACPHSVCRASAGTPCRGLASGYHLQRLDAALRAANGQPPPSTDPPPATPPRPWCGRCHDETRTKTAIRDGRLVAVPCPLCQPTAEP